MDIIFQGKYDDLEAMESLSSVIKLFKENYGITHFYEMRLSVTLSSKEGEPVELIDTETSEVYRVFEVYRQGHDLVRGKGLPNLKLVVDNTRSVPPLKS